MAYCIYLRKSRADLEAEAHGEMETLARHEQALLELARRNKYAITEIYREVVSGDTIAARPIMQRLLNEVQDGRWRGVLVMDIDRLARGQTIDQGIVAQAFMFSGTLIITPLKTYDPNNEFDQEYFEFGLFMARREYKIINRRLQRGRLAAVREGKYMGVKAPYGYKRVRLENRSGYTLEPDDTRADVVRMIFSLYTREMDRLGVSKLANHLNALGIPTMKGGPWSTMTLRDMLQNPVYIGKIRWNSRPETKRVEDGRVITSRPRAASEDWILVDGLHQAIVDESVWQAAQVFLKLNKPVPVPRGGPVKNPLAGLVVCGLCGRKMNRRPKGASMPRDMLMCPNPQCKNVASYLDVVEESIITALMDWLKAYKADWNGNAGTQAQNIDCSIEAKALEKELSTLNGQLMSLYDLLEQRVYSKELFLERSQRLNARIEAAKRKLDEIGEAQKAQTEALANEEGFVPAVERALDMYFKTDDPAQRNELIREALTKVIYTKHMGGRWYNERPKFELELFPNLPR